MSTPPESRSRRRQPDTLTPRQAEVLDLLARRHTNAEIAERLGLSLAGAKWHVSEIISVLGVDTREEAAEWWRQHNGLPARIRRLVFTLVPGGGWRWLAGGAAAACIAAVAVIVYAVVGGTEDGAPGPAVPDPTENAATTTPGVTPTPDPRRPIPGIVYQVIDAIESQDRQAFEQLTYGRPMPCSPPRATGIGVGPPCPDGVAEGTPVGSYVILGDNCHGTLMPATPEVADRLLQVATNDLELHALVWSKPDAMFDKHFFTLIYDAPDGRARTFRVSNEGIDAFTTGACLGPASEMVSFYMPDGTGETWTASEVLAASPWPP